MGGAQANFGAGLHEQGWSGVQNQALPARKSLLLCLNSVPKFHLFTLGGDSPLPQGPILKTMKPASCGVDRKKVVGTQSPELMPPFLQETSTQVGGAGGRPLPPSLSSLPPSTRLGVVCPGMRRFAKCLSHRPFLNMYSDVD